MNGDVEDPAAAAPLPLYLEIRRALEAAILSGEWPPGHRVPSEHELTSRYNCSRMTVNKALSALAEAGLILRRRRSGTVVAVPASRETALDIHDIQAEVAESGRAYRYEILSRRRRAASAEDARRLEVKAGAPVLAVATLHFAADRPFALEDRLISLAAVPQAEAEPFAEAPPGSWLLARVPWTEAEHQIRAANASPETARRLGVPRGTACLVVERRTWQGGEPVTCVELRYPGNRHQLVGRFRSGPAFEGGQRA